MLTDKIYDNIVGEIESEFPLLQPWKLFIETFQNLEQWVLLTISDVEGSMNKPERSL